MEREPTTVQGKVTREVYARGSKSQHPAVMLETAGGKFKLRRPGGHPFADPELEKLVGTEIEAVGNVLGNVFVLKGWTPTAGE